MPEPTSVSRAIGGEGKVITLETGKLAQLADGAVVATLGDTMILVTATGSKSVRPGADFFPLTVDIEERMYAAGKIPGSFFRREGRSGDQAILTCRLIDRPLRPSFPDGFRNEVHVVGTVMGADQANPHDVLAINAASAAICLSGMPFGGPIGAVRIAHDADGNWIPHPTYAESEASTFEMVVAGRALDDGDVAIMMVEAGGTESSWSLYESGTRKVDETVLAEGLEAAKRWILDAIELQEELLDAVGETKSFDYELQVDYPDEILAAVEAAESESGALASSQQIADKTERGVAEEAARASILEAVAPRFDDDAEAAIKAAIRSVTKSVVRRQIVENGIRIDGRGTTDIRPLSSEVGVVPTAHGSGLFQRGETQVLNVTTLAMTRMDQMIDSIDPTERKRYLHHYNFPPFSTGETGFMRGPKRREIGHGMLAERALLPVVPSVNEFPYTLRLVSEVLSSNGSTSMGSVCASSLSLMDAGVPIKAPVAGIAMGLVHSDDSYITLTDILGAEDAFGDMDFKVAGTAEFVTALQLDTKIDGIPADVLAQALQQAREARMQILDVMGSAIAAPRAEVGPTAPKIISFEVPADKIGEIIGPKGKVINAIQEETGADITVDDGGTVGVVSVASTDSGAVSEAERQIKLIIDPPTAEVGETYKGKVVNITKFGAFVNILPGRDGLVHISKLGGGKRIDRVEDVVDLGDDIEVRVDDVDPAGKISLSPVGSLVGNGAGDGEESSTRSETEAPARSSGGGDREYVSFEESFEDELRAEFGDLGPAATTGNGGGGRRGGGRNGPRRGGRRRSGRRS